MTQRSCRAVLVNKRGLFRWLTVAAAIAACTLIIQTPEVAADQSGQYTVTALKAPYTLVFSVRIAKPGFGLRKNTPLTSSQTGTLTLSANGKKVVYLAKFGKWTDVIICDLPSDTVYTYNNSSTNAIIEPGVNLGLVSMWLLPMPGSGYDFYPMFRSFHYSSAGASNATMAVIGAVASAKDNYIQSLLYEDTLVQINQKTHPSTVSTCRLIMANRPALVQEMWKFSGYHMIGQAPVAASIDHVLNVPVDDAWPPSAMKRDGEVRYTLLSASGAALPDRSFDLRTYLPANTAITDARRHP